MRAPVKFGHIYVFSRAAFSVPPVIVSVLMPTMHG